jgi:hypothetical protein
MESPMENKGAEKVTSVRLEGDDVYPDSSLGAPARNAHDIPNLHHLWTWN